MLVLKINDLNEFKERFKYIAKDFQEDFGLPYDYLTAESDDEFAFAMAISVLDELNIDIESDDENLNKYLNKIRMNLINRAYQSFLEKKGNR